MARYLLILNRRSGGSQRGLDGKEVCRIVEAAFQAEGHELISRRVEPREIAPALAETVAERPAGVIAAGGDGTVSMAARHLGGTGIALGALPMGTFNLAARDLGVPLDIPEAARFLARAEPLPIDVLDVDGRACLCTTILGFYPEFARTFERRDHGGRLWRKAIKLVTHLPRTFSQSRTLNLTWRTGEAGGTVRTKFAAFVPGRYRATAGIVPARADFLSGTMSAYIGKQENAREAVRGMLDYLVGRQDQNPDVLMLRAGQLELRDGGRRRANVMIDGEILRLPFPLHLKILPGHLKVLTTPDSLADPDPA